MNLSKSDRVKLIFNRLSEKDIPASHDEAMALIAVVMNDVEDQFSGVPYNLEEPGTDGRMYPPHERFRYAAWERPGVRCYRQTAHATFIGDNGAIEIRSRRGSDLGGIVFEKPGKDGRKVSDHDTAG